MHTRNLEHAEKNRIWHPPQEVHARRVQRVAEFLQHLLTVSLALWEPYSVTHVVAANDDHVGVRVSREDGRHATHENLEPTVGLKIAGDVGDDLILYRQLATAIGELEFRGRIGLDQSGFDAFVDDPKHGAVAFGV